MRAGRSGVLLFQVSVGCFFVVWLGLYVSFAQEGFSFYLSEFKSNEKYAHTRNLLLQIQ